MKKYTTREFFNIKIISEKQLNKLYKYNFKSNYKDDYFSSEIWVSFFGCIIYGERDELGLKETQNYITNSLLQIMKEYEI